MCRFPLVIDGRIIEPIIRRDHDRKSRIRVSLLPQRNNAYLNEAFHSSLLTIAHSGYHNIQYIGNTVGAAEYVAKAEEPDKKLLTNIYAQKISHIVDNGSLLPTGNVYMLLVVLFLGVAQLVHFRHAIFCWD